VLTLESLPTESSDQSPAPRGASVDPFPESQRRALVQREESALILFYDSYFDRVYGYVRRMVGEEHLAEDLTQEILMHIMQSLDTYDPERALRPWVFTIATNKVRDYWRGRRHQTQLREISLEVDESGGWTGSNATRPELELSARETTNELSKAIESLPESMRVTLILRYYEGLSFDAIGRIVDRTEIAVRKRYSRALDELRKLLTGTDLGGAQA
jgi:RNA polymerase sigma-70 factor (ECF subfamily)